MSVKKATSPKLSIVVGSHNARSSIGSCLRSLEGQRHGWEMEIIVVDNSTDGTDQIVAKEFSGVQLVQSPECQFIPELWEQGIRRSSGEIVAITTAHCIPEVHWVQEILKAHEESPCVGIAGAIENEAQATLVDWAVYFCRYSRYMRPFLSHSVNDIPADNASYKRWALDRCEDVRRNGFWEPEIHAELIKDGFELLMNPAIGVCHQTSFSFLDFVRQRFWHGKQFGMDRAAKLSTLWRAIYILFSPLVPFVFLFRITRNVVARWKNVDKLLLSLPILFLFLLSWSLGELIGSLRISR